MNRGKPILTQRIIARRRLANQYLIGAPLASPLAVVRQLGAVQSQDYAGGKWGVAQRTAGATDADVERALTEGTIVRTHVLRPTWHFVAAEDIRWMLELTAPRVRKAMTPYDRQLGLDEKVFARSAAVITKALSDGTQLTRTELGQVLQRSRIDASGTQRLAHLMMRAELDGLICSGARKGKQTTYALLDERVPAAPALQRDEALARLATLYFPTRGPATVHDFAWWSGFTMGDARRALDAIASTLTHLETNGKTYWFSGELPAARATANVAHLLPNYDEYFIGLRDRSAIGELVKHSPLRVPGDAFAAHIVSVDGQLVGGWDRTVTARSAAIRLRLAVPVTASQRRSIDAQARRFGEFLELPVTVSARVA